MSFIKDKYCDKQTKKSLKRAGVPMKLIQYLVNRDQLLII